MDGARARALGSIRDLILFPTLALTVLLVLLTGLACGTWAVSRAWSERIERGLQIVQTLERSNYPLTDMVLDQLHGLGGTEFALMDESGTLVKATHPALLGAHSPRPDRVPGHNFSDTWHLEKEGPGYRVAVVNRGLAGPHNTARLLVLLPEPALQAAAWEAGQTILVLTLLGAVLAAVLALTVSRALAAPLVRIATALYRIGHGEPFGELPLDRPDEIGDLAVAVHRLGERLAALERERAEAQRLQLVRQLSAGLAHEIRNPLTAARMTLQLLERRHTTELNLGEPLRMALSELSRMERQVKRFLQIARPDPPRIGSVRIHALVQEAAARVAPAFELRGQRLAIESGSADTALLRIDPDQIGQVFVNLLQNALDASPRTEPVRIRARVDGNRGIVAVEDAGPGVGPEIRERLFQPFVTTKPEGVGLGLALCASLVREHDGSLSYVRADGVTRFEVALPLDLSDGPYTYSQQAEPSPSRGSLATGVSTAWPT